MSATRIFFQVAIFGVLVCGEHLFAVDEILICDRINAKQMPSGFHVDAMKFTGPAGDGRRGSAGFVVKSTKGVGTRLSFQFQRDASGYGFQAIHPFAEGHVVVSVHSRGVTIHRGGFWGDFGWGDPSNSDSVRIDAKMAKRLPLQAGKTYHFVSELSAKGDYRLLLNDEILCQHQIKGAKPLTLEVPENKRVWGGSSWNRKPFEGDGFSAKLQPGDVGLILGPMDGSGPNQHFQNVSLALLPGTQSNAPTAKLKTTDASLLYKKIFDAIDAARENETLTYSKLAGGSGGGIFDSSLTQPGLLVGIDYTLSRFYGGHLTVKSLRPIFMTPKGIQKGIWHGAPHGKVYTAQAKEGFVVTALVAKHGHRLDGIRLLYMGVKNNRLNPELVDRSKWIGGLGGGAEKIYGSYGDPVVGVFGRRGRDIDAIGLVQFDQE